MNKQMEELKIISSVRKMVRKISEASFSKDLGDYHIGFSLRVNILTMELWFDNDIENCFIKSYGASCTWVEETPKDESGISAFESEVELALTQIFEYVKGDK